MFIEDKSHGMMAFLPSSFQTNPLQIEGPKSEEEPFLITQVPERLYQEISRALGIDEEGTIVRLGRTYIIRRLNPDHPITGFNGVIGLAKKDENHEDFRFSLWNRPPLGNDYHVFLPNTVLTLIAGPQRAGEWAYGKGERMVEGLWAELSSSFDKFINLRSDVAVLTCLVLQRATQLAQNQNCSAESFWEQDRNPSGNFSKPNRP